MLLQLLMRLQSILDAESTTMVVNFLQHVIQHPDPAAEIKRLLKVLEPELAPQFKFSVVKKS